jgi:flagellar basal-body rod protein FlgF
MDRMLYIAMSGAKESSLALAANSNNLANANTTGFKADFNQFRAMHVAGPGHDSRAYALSERPATDLTAGPMNYTGRDLDVAVSNDDWLVVQTPKGDEGLVKTASLQIKADGSLTDISGHPIMGQAGPIVIPPAEKIEIGTDGTISIVPLGQPAQNLEIIDQIRIVTANDSSPKQMEKGLDGFIRSKAGTSVSLDGRLMSGVLEASNVNTVQALVDMISLQRKYEIQVKMMNTSNKNEEKNNSLLSLR